MDNITHLPPLGDDKPEDRPQRKWIELFYPNPVPPRPEAFDLLLIEADRHKAYVRAHGKESLGGEQAWRASIACKLKIGALVEVARREQAGATPEAAEEERITRRIEANRVAEEERVAAAKERARRRQEIAELDGASREGIESQVEGEQDRRADKVAAALGEELRKPKGVVVPMKREERMERAKEGREPVEDREDPPPDWRPLKQDARRLKATKVPKLKFRISELWPRCWLSLLNGDGGAGKSTLLTQFFSALSDESPIFGLATMFTDLLLISTEENDEIASRRLNGMPDVGSFPVFNLLDWPTGCEICVRTGNGLVAPGPFLRVLREMIGDLKPELVGLDHVGDIFMINENDKGEVNAALRFLQRLHAEFEVDFILTQHISKAGMASRRMDSGTPQWHNKARWRAALYPPGLGDTASEDETLAALAAQHRVLEIMKDNEGGTAGRKLNLLRERWHFVKEAGEISKARERVLADELLAFALRTLPVADGRRLPLALKAGGKSGGGLVSQFAAATGWKGRATDAQEVLERLIAEGKLGSVRDGPSAARQRVYVVLAGE